MTFHIDDQTQAKLVGPAQFMLNQKWEWDDALYTLQLLYGNFVEMESLNEETTQNIALVSKDVTIHQEKKDKASHFQLISDGETQRIENKWAQIIVTSLQDDKSIETEIHNKQTLSIASNDITLIDDETQITRILTQKDVSQTIAFADVKEKIEQPEEITAAALSEVFEEVDVKVDARVAAAIDTMITKQSDGKKIPTTEQDKQLRSNLYGWFLNPDAQALLVAYVLWDDASVQKYTQIFGDRLTNIAKAFDVELRKTTWLQWLVAASSDIKQSLSATYYIPPRYMDNIAMIGRIVSYIISQEQSKSDAKPTLPANLIFQ